ncbi:penicillin-binding protein 2 [Nocardioides mesophilus]|uniref:Penicillin-binding protein 2 n=2 Tax=Nocardioides mesophilus TaxID=433659 RepID=A0A7G9RGL9_9ACTN|nr:penicillin-binding protein 2 [Nocardioides mesophilus]
MVISVFAVRLFQIQGIDAQAYVARAEAEGVVTVELPATRGSITDRNGVPLAESVDGLMLVADPTMTKPHASEIATIIARRLSVDYFEVLSRLRKPDTRFQYLARRVPSTLANEVLDEIKARGFSGVDTRRDPVRDYPARDVGANLVGFMNDLGKAAEGAELMFDPMLSGVDGSATYETGGGNRIPLGDNEVVAPRSGHDLALTIDRDVQWYTQRVLRTTVTNAGGDSGSAIVLDTRTGEALAVADYPTFDPNDPSSATKGNLSSRAIRDAYEPGSVNKVLTMAALLDQGLVTPQTKITVPPVLPRSDRVIHDYFVHDTLHLTLTGVIAKSSNIGTVLAADQIKDKTYYRYLKAFGLGSRTGVGVEGESAGVLPDFHDWLPIQKDTISFGQGVAVSALQMAAAVNTIANGGVYVQPSLVKGTATTSTGETVGSATSTTRRVISEKAARQVTGMMEAVTDLDEGTAPSAAIPGYRVAGKTGTAQRVGAKCGCYDGTFTVSFAGFAPADDPRFLVYVVVQNPAGGGGGSVGGPAFNKIMTHVLQKYAVPPTGSVAPAPRVEW